MQGQLFATDTLFDGLTRTPAWASLEPAAFADFVVRLKTIYADFGADSPLNEAQTEDHLIEPVLDLLGWEGCWTSQVNLSDSGREDVPDFVLFADAQARARALAEKDAARRLRHGLAVLEAKRWLRPLDRGEDSAAPRRKRRDFGAPSSQMLRYLSRAEVMSDRAIKWGILTNGAVWRLYWQDARSRAEDFFELDLAALLGVPGLAQTRPEFALEHGLKLFYLLFGRAGFLPQAWDSAGRSLHAIALAQGRRYEETVSAELGRRVFEEVFPALCAALAEGDPERPAGALTERYLDELREAALTLLYRLLFLMYAEDRRLLPALDARYAAYSLTALREAIARARDEGLALSGRSTRYWDTLADLFRLVADGDDAVGLPPYNGGLFEPQRAPLLARAKLADAALAPIVDALSRRLSEACRPRIDYRDLSVAHLGSIYERLLEYRLEAVAGDVRVRKAGFARRGSGSYYTPEPLVRLIVEETVGRLAAERQQAFDALLDRLRRKASLTPPQWEEIDRLDPASQLLALKVCDPAMGSGHFLVALVDWLADRVLEAAQAAAEAVNACPFAAHLAEQNRPWASPIMARIADIRRRILRQAYAHGWTLEAAQLDDRHLVRRMILKRVVFGVDKNPMAVELAKVALWLHTFTVGAPLSFLDHHLRVGDSLFGARLDRIRAELSKLPGGLLQQADLQRLDSARLTLQAIGEITDIDIAEAHHSKALMQQAEDALRPLKQVLDFLEARRWAGPEREKDYTTAWVDLLNQEYGATLLEAIELLARPGVKLFSERQRKAHAVVQEAQGLAARERFLHWELAFPTVFAAGGFDAVVGNPPWDRLKLQEVEWFAERRPEIARQARAADRKRLIAAERAQDTPLWREYLAASAQAETAARLARTSGDYPLLGGGDVNLYALFVERAQSLIKPEGLVGLLVPSGIAADKSASAFFRSLTDDGGCRLAALYDFENRGNPGGSYFPDVDSRFKFSVLVFGGQGRRLSAARCAFYLHDVAELADPARTLALSGDDFRRVNPNTGAAPVFRSARDAAIALRLYRQHPVLVDRSGGEVRRAWPVRYATMFHMTNDSDKFLTRAELKAQGWEPTAPNRWRRGEDLALPLYEGKMVGLYDHRAADVVVNPDNLHRPAQPRPIPEEDKRRPDRYPEPQFWVRASEIPEYADQSAMLAFKDVTAPTNARTMIAALLPRAAYGNTLPLILLPTADATLLAANLNCLAFDYLARQKVHGQHLNWYIVEQLPVIAPETYARPLGDFVPGLCPADDVITVADFVRSEVLALSYTAHDLAPLARDLGYVDAQGKPRPPFVWDAEDRARRMARLDALYFRLYGLERDEIEYILSTFPLLREQDGNAHGRYRTRERILAYLDGADAQVAMSQASASEARQ